MISSIRSEMRASVFALFTGVLEFPVRVSSSPCNKTTDFNNSSNAMALIVSYRFSSSLSPVPLDTPVSVAHWDVPGQMFPHWNCPDPGGGGVSINDTDPVPILYTLRFSAKMKYYDTMS